jgi:hypothetical protein
MKQEVMREMAEAIANGGWEATYAIFGRTLRIHDPDERAEVLNCLLVMSGHRLHQEVIRQIQLLRNPSSVPYIRKMLEDEFRMLEYTCSESAAIAKWFSHALADINTPESIALIREFAHSSDPGVADEMAYRLRRLNA